MTGKCPTPTKAKYTSKVLAEGAARTIKKDPTRDDRPMFAYRCGCGRWHLTSGEIYDRRGEKGRKGGRGRRRQ